MTTILPCPFCGGNGRVQTGYVSLGGSKRYALVRCMSCDATGPKEFGDMCDECLKDNAILGWNDTVDTTSRKSMYS